MLSPKDLCPLSSSVLSADLFTLVEWSQLILFVILAESLHIFTDF